MNIYQNKIYFLLFIIFAFYTKSISQSEFIFKKYDVRNGLSSNKINNIYQDKEGFIWIATKDGLNRFDSHSVLHFFHVPEDSNSLTYNNVAVVNEDNYGNIWAGTPKGLNVIDKKSRNITRYVKETQNSKGLSNVFVSGILCDSNNVVWVATYEALDKFTVKYSQSGNIVNTDIVHYKHPLFSQIGHVIYDVHKSTDGLLWIGMETGDLLLFDPVKELFLTTKEKYKFDLNNKKRINDIKEVNDKIYIATWGNGIYTYNKKTKQIKNLRFEGFRQNEISEIVISEENKLYGATLGGLIVYDLKTGEYHNYESTDNSTSLSNNILVSALKDKQNGLWLGTSLNGINYFYIDRKKFTSWSKISFIENKLPSNAVSSFYQNENNIWFGTRNGYAIYNPDDYSFSEPYCYNRLPYSNIRKIYYEGNNTCICISPNAMFRYNQESNTINEITFSENYKDHMNKLITRNKGGNFCAIDLQHIIYVVSPKGEILFTNNTLRSIKDNVAEIDIDTKNNLWVFTNDRIIKIQAKEYMSDKEFSYESTEYIIDVRLEVNHVLFDSLFIWISTSNGLLRFNKNTKEQKFITKKDGLSDTEVFCTLKDDSENLWISTAFGLNLFSLKTNDIRVFYLEDGLPGNVFISGSGFKSLSGELFFGGEDGFTHFDPNDISYNTTVPKLVFTEFKISNETVVPGKNNPIQNDINYVSKIQLKHNQSDITLKWSALDYIHPEKNMFQYRLMGQSNTWSKISNRHEVNYSGLNPGNYVFEVKGSNNDNVWNEIPRQIAINISPPFWMTWGFRISVMITIVLIFIIIYKIRIRNYKIRQAELEKNVKERTIEIREKNEELHQQADNLQEINILLKERQDEIETQSEKLEEANHELVKLNATKDKFFSIIAHDLKNPFQGIIGYTSLLKRDFEKMEKNKKIDFIEQINKSSQSAFLLLDNLLYWSRTQTSNIDINPTVFDCQVIADKCIQLLKLNADNKKIKLINSIPEKTMVFADKDMFTTILRNLLNNAIKFTNSGGKVEFLTEVNESSIKIFVKDTGVGMSQEVIDRLFRIDKQVSTMGTSGEGGTGLGLIICKEFVNINKGRIEVESKEDRGSTFIINLPFDPDGKIIKPVQLAVEEEDVFIDNSDERLENIAGKVILVVEDNEIIRSNIIESLGEKFSIHVAENGAIGWEKALETIPDIIITDVMMPVMDGFELTKKIIEDKRTCHIPLIILTAKISEQSKTKGLMTGAIDYLTKPFNPDELKLKVSNILNLREEFKKSISKSIDIDPKQIAITKRDEEFINTVLDYIENNIQKSDLTVEVLCEEMNITYIQLYRKLLALTGMPANEFIRVYRLKRAAQYIKQSDFSFKEIAYQVGFNDPDYFSRAFKKMFGMSPRDYKINN